MFKTAEPLKKLFLLPVLLLLSEIALAQKPHITFIQPGRIHNNTTRDIAYVSGNTCKSCRLSLDGSAVKVYPTGAFAVKLTLKEGNNIFRFKSINATGEISKSITFKYEPHKISEVTDFRIESVTADPAGEAQLMPGDILNLKIKAQSGNQMVINSKYAAYEQPASLTGEKGLYQFSHSLEKGDPILLNPIKITMTDKTGQSTEYIFHHKISLLNTQVPVIGKTTGKVPYLEFGRGGDRLGGAKINYIDTAVLVHITGKLDGLYRIALAPGHTAYIPENQISLMPPGTFIPHSFTGSWQVSGDEKYDYVRLHLDTKLPYTTFQKTDPARIIVDVYGATPNSNWIAQLESAKEVKNVQYEQLSDGVFRMIVSLKHSFLWGYHIYYEGNTLTIRVKRQPPARLPKLTIAVDAGHGGSNPGARGPTGVYEKTITLEIANRLKQLLTDSGAKVIMTRSSDVTRSMVNRILFLREKDPDLLVSIHLNSSGNPIDVSGTSTYYRYIGFRPLSQAILKRMLALGLHDFGNIGRFNFALNGPTEYPNALVETVFISNPEDEMKVLNPEFQEKIARAIRSGIEDFLKEAE